MKSPCSETVPFGQLGCRYEDNSTPHWPHLFKTESQITDLLQHRSFFYSRAFIPSPPIPEVHLHLNTFADCKSAVQQGLW